MELMEFKLVSCLTFVSRGKVFPQGAPGIYQTSLKPRLFICHETSGR